MVNSRRNIYVPFYAKYSRRSFGRRLPFCSQRKNEYEKCLLNLHLVRGVSQPLWMGIVPTGWVAVLIGADYPLKMRGKMIVRNVDREMTTCISRWP